MKTPSHGSLRGRWRRRLFSGFIITLLVAGVGLMISGPIVAYGDNTTTIGAPLVAIEIALLVAGLVWLVSFVRSRRDSPDKLK